jgi:hypothetical protein
MGIGAKSESFSSYLKDWKLSKFSDIWTIDKTHNQFLAHKLKMRFNLLSFAYKLFLMLLKRPHPSNFSLQKMFAYSTFSFCI